MRGRWEQSARAWVPPPRCNRLPAGEVGRDLIKRATFDGRLLFLSDDLAAWFEGEWNFLSLFKLCGIDPFL